LFVVRAGVLFTVEVGLFFRVEAGVLFIVRLGVLLTDAVGEFVGHSPPFCTLSITTDGAELLDNNQFPDHPVILSSAATKRGIEKPVFAGAGTRRGSRKTNKKRNKNSSAGGDSEIREKLLERAKWGKNQKEEVTFQLINTQRNLNHREKWRDRQIFERSAIFLTITVEPQDRVVNRVKKIQNEKSRTRLDRFKADSVTMLA
jgi:hypothetical protein